jgi:hypothetical protein
MGWKAAAILVENRTVDELLEELDIYRLSDRELYMTDAWYELAVARVGTWLVFFTGGKRQVELARALSNGTRAFAFDLNSIHTSYGFDYWVDGACVRSLCFTERECVRDEGKKLAAETKVRVPKWGHDDDWVLGVMKKVIGVGADALEEIEYVALSTHDG